MRSEFEKNQKYIILNFFEKIIGLIYKIEGLIGNEIILVGNKTTNLFMEITSLNCNNCGANLEIKPNIKFFTCTFCKSALAIKKSGNVMFTEVLDEIKKDTETLIENSEEMLLEKKIARLDREWLANREQYSIRGKDGVVMYPSETSSSSLGVYIPLFIFWIIFIFFLSFFASKSRNGMEGSLIFGMMVFVTFIIIMIGYSSQSVEEKRKKYLTAKNEYEKKRKILLAELDD